MQNKYSNSMVTDNKQLWDEVDQQEFTLADVIDIISCILGGLSPTIEFGKEIHGKHV